MLKNFMLGEKRNLKFSHFTEKKLLDTVVLSIVIKSPENAKYSVSSNKRSFLNCYLYERTSLENGHLL